MSWSASAYVRTLTTAPTGEKITRSEKLLLMVLADRYNEDEGCAWPSLKNLAADALMSRSHACTLLTALERKGVITRERQWRGPKERENTVYRFAHKDSQGGSPVNGLGTKSSSVAHRTRVVHSRQDHGSPVVSGQEPLVNRQITDSAETVSLTPREEAKSHNFSTINGIYGFCRRCDTWAQLRSPCVT